MSKGHDFSCELQNEKPPKWNLFAYHGWTSAVDVILRTSTYFLNIYRLLIQLELILKIAPQKPRAQQDGLIVAERRPSFSDLLSGIELAPGPVLPIDKLKTHLMLVESDSTELGLKRTASRLKHIAEYLEGLPDQATLDLAGDEHMKHEIRVLREDLIDDLDERVIFFPDVEKYEKYYPTIVKLFGAETLYAFRPANKDIISAHACYVTDEPTASVFHSMRVAEFGLRALTLHFEPNAEPDKLEWGPLIGNLEDRIRRLHESSQNPDPERKQKLDFYGDALAQCRFLKHWRDAVMHTRGHYEDPEALQVLNHVREFLRLLVKNGVSLPEQTP